MKRIVTSLWVPLLCWLAFANTADAADLQLNITGNTLSVQAEQVPLQDVLQRLSAHGIVVQIDPALNPTVNASFQDKNLEDGLKTLIRPLNSIFVWKRDKAPADAKRPPGYQLSEIRIFEPGQEDRMIQLEEDPDEAAAQPPEKDERPAMETPVIIKANRVFVPVVLTYNNAKIETTLLFDTGAGSIVLHQEVADRLGISDVVPAKGHGVGGFEISATVSRLQSVQVGPYEKQNLRAAIVAYTGPPDSQYNGLLGMNFLRGLKYEIDFDAQVIRWENTREGSTPEEASE
jgi:predicted aspartyl protease